MFLVECFGNYSHTYNWDCGLQFFNTKEATQEDIDYWENNDYTWPLPSIEHAEGYTKLVYLDEHSGTRNATFAVFAANANDAEQYARERGRIMFPEKD